MKFFIPAARDAAMAENALASVRRFLADQGFPTTARRIRRIVFTHDREEFDLEVGGLHHGLAEECFYAAGGEDQMVRYLVFAILEASSRSCYYVCTGDRGVIRGTPWLVGWRAASLVEDFD